jgi:hypothetical protein
MLAQTRPINNLSQLVQHWWGKQIDKTPLFPMVNQTGHCFALGEEVTDNEVGIYDSAYHPAYSAA